MLLHVIQDASYWFSHGTLGSELVRSLHAQSLLDQMVLATQITQTDLVGDVQRAFDNFVKTGQAWAFLIGLVLGYMLKAFTSFG
ncbi:MAG: hypothetical protein NW220_19880 [Leptolyngbyaceae cyanobacterium bins.349]|nr:hypothetical protein [Leptolyngbyaceae cyanobacterium bins.349]